MIWQRILLVLAALGYARRTIIVDSSGGRHWGYKLGRPPEPKAVKKQAPTVDPNQLSLFKEEAPVDTAAHMP